MKNLAGHDVSIFLYRFVLTPNGISFVLNESIAEDMYPEIDAKVLPLTEVCGDTLIRYKHLSTSNIIMDGNILTDGCFEVMLSPGLGKHFGQQEKKNLFKDAYEIANLLIEVMDRRSKEIEDGDYPGPQPVVEKIKNTEAINDGLEALGKNKDLEEQHLFVKGFEVQFAENVR